MTRHCATASIAVLLSMAAMAVSTPAIAQSMAAGRRLDIPAGPLGTALNQLGRSAGVAISYDPSVVRGKTTRGVRGATGTAEALDVLLQGTALRARPDGLGGFTLEATTRSPARIIPAAYTTMADARPLETTGPDIVVTGEKLERSLQDTASAVTVLRNVDSTENRSVYQAIERVPNVLATAADLPTIRGVSGSGAAGGIFTLMSGARPRVATLIDGLPETFGGQRYADAGVWDIDQIEVLRGPQSTTQGWNSIGGAIVMRSKDPTFTWQGAVRAGFETEDDKAHLAAALSGPIVADKLALRLSADGVRGSSYIDYPGSGWPFDPSDIKQTNLRGKLLWQAAPALTVKLTGTHRVQQGEYLYIASGPNFFDYKFDNTDMNTRYSDSRVDTLSGELSYDLSDTLSAHLLYGHSWYNAHFEQANALGTGRGNLTLDEDADTVEARLVYNAANGRSNAVLGLYHYGRHQDLTSDLGVNGPDSFHTYAIYADAMLGLTDALRLLAGARIERQKQKRQVALSWGSVSADIAETYFLPKLGVTWGVSPSTNLSLSARKGYSPGGGAIDWDNGSYYDYDKEEVWTYEATARTQTADHRLTLGANLFYNDYDGYQGLVNYTFTNIPKGRSYGAEVEAEFRPVPELSLHGAVGLLDTKVTTPPAAFPQIAGERFNNAPRFTATAGIDYRSGNGLFGGGSLSRLSSYQAQVESGTAIIAGDYWLANAHVGYRTEHVTIRAYVRNLTGSDVIYGGRTSWAGTQAQVGQPRTFGVSLEGRF